MIDLKALGIHFFSAIVIVYLIYIIKEKYRTTCKVKENFNSLIHN